MPTSPAHTTTIAEGFRTYQTIILDLLEAAANLFHGDRRAEPEHLDDSRAAIGSALEAYQAFKHHAVYDPIIAAGSPDASTAAALKADCTRLTADYRGYCEAYRGGVRDAFDRYRRVTLDMLRRIRLALIREFELVRQLKVYADLKTRPVG